MHKNIGQGRSLEVSDPNQNTDLRITQADDDQGQVAQKSAGREGVEGSSEELCTVGSRLVRQGRRRKGAKAAGSRGASICSHPCHQVTSPPCLICL